MSVRVCEAVCEVGGDITQRRASQFSKITSHTHNSPITHPYIRICVFCISSKITTHAPQIGMCVFPTSPAPTLLGCTVAAVPPPPKKAAQELWPLQRHSHAPTPSTIAAPRMDEAKSSP